MTDLNALAERLEEDVIRFQAAGYVHHAVRLRQAAQALRGMGEAVAWQARIKPDGEWFTLEERYVERRRAEPGIDVRPLFARSALKGGGSE